MHLPDQRQEAALSKGQAAPAPLALNGQAAQALCPSPGLRQGPYCGWMTPSMAYTTPLPALIGSPTTLKLFTYNDPSLPV